MTDPSSNSESAGEPGGLVDPQADPGPPSELLGTLHARGARGARYRLLGEMARGGMGAILRVWDDELRRTLAMKVVLGTADAASGDTPAVDPKTLGRFLEEAQITGQLDHPGIVPVHELGLDSTGRVYFTMRLVKGEDLRAIFEHVKTGHDGWNQVRALGVLLRVCEALGYAHSKGVIHRDLKPANVMVGKFGEVYVMDWGLARVLGRPDQHDLRLQQQGTTLTVKTERRDEREQTPDSPLVTMDGDVVGTPSFMPPEQARGELDRLGPHSDVYSIGAMLYQLVTGEMPYIPAGTRLSPRTVLLAALNGPPRRVEELAPGTPPELVAILEKAMAREIARRYATTVDLAADLRAYLERRVVAAYETGTWAETRKWVQRNRPLAASLVVAVLAIVAGATAFAIKAEEATAARDVAEQQTRDARASLYVAAVTAAASAWRLNEPASVRRHLDSAPVELRNWEWRYIDATTDTSLLALGGHENGTEFAEFSPDGSRILTLSNDGIACRVWDARSGAQIAQLGGHTEEITAAAFSPEGSRIVTASNDGTARVWLSESGDEVVRFTGHGKPVYSATFSPDGSRVVSGSADVTVCVWDPNSAALLLRLQGHTAGVTTCTFSQDGTRIVTGSFDGTGRVWDASSGAQMIEWAVPIDWIWTAKFNPSGSRVLGMFRGGGERADWSDTGARLWDSTSGVEVVKLTEDGPQGDSVDFSPDGSEFVGACGDGIARTFDAESGAELVRLVGHGSQVLSASFSPDGSRIVTGSRDTTARVWDSRSGAELAVLKGHTEGVWSAKFSRDGSRIVTASGDGTARVWDTSARGECASLHCQTEAIGSATFSPDGSQIAIGASDGTTRIWDTISATQVAVLDCQADSAQAVAFSPDGGRVVTASRDVRIWDANTGLLLGILSGPEYVESVTFSPDGMRILTASADDSACEWDALSGKEGLRVNVPKDEYLVSAAFSPDGMRFVTASGRVARIWNATNGAELVQVEGHTQLIESVRFSYDGTRIVTASRDGTARVWAADSGGELVRLAGHTSGVESAAFSPDDSRIVTAGDVTARIWDAHSGVELVRLQAGTAAVRCAEFSPDGTRIVTADRDGARIWDSISHRVRQTERAASLAGDAR